MKKPTDFELSDIFKQLEPLAEELKPQVMPRKFIYDFCKKYRDDGYTWPTIAVLWNDAADKHGWRPLNRRTLNEYFNTYEAENGSND